MNEQSERDHADIFCEVTNLPRPRNLLDNWKGNEDTWLQPIQHMYNLADDEFSYKRGLQAAYNIMKRDGMTIATPKSMLPFYVGVMNNKRPEPTPSDFKAYRNKLIGHGYNVKF